MKRLASTNASRVVIVVALALALPSLFSPLVADDHVQALKYKTWAESHPSRHWLELLNDYSRFVSGDLEANQHAIEQGLGWWMAPDLRLAFWRPVSAATHVLDHLLWPGNAVMMHVHSLLWFLFLLLALNALYRRLLSPPIATLALALYAIDDARGMVLSWVANRNALIAGFFGVCVIIAHDKWRRDGWRAGAFIGPFLLALGLLSAEAATSTLGFLLAYALCLDRANLSHRLSSLLPYLVVVGAWQYAYFAGGYGASATHMYMHPLHEPLAFALATLERAPVLFLAQITPYPAESWFLLPGVAKGVVFVVALALSWFVVSRAYRRATERQEANFWWLSVLCSLVPISATLPGDRNLVFVAMAAYPALAMLFVGSQMSAIAPRADRVVVGALVLFNLALAPLALPFKSLSTFGMKHMLTAADRSVPRDTAIKNRTLVVVSTKTEGPLSFAWSERDALGVPKPRRTRILAVCHGDVVVTRLDDFTLRVQPDQGFLNHVVHQLGRDSTRPFQRGNQITLSNMVATVTEIVQDWRPKTVEFRFATPIDSPEWFWMRGKGLGYVDFTPPKVGETIVIRTE